MAGRQARWRGAVAATLVLASAGIWDGNGTLLLAAAIPLAYLAYGSVSTVQVPDDLSLSRVIEPSPAPPGRPVTISLSVTNDTDRTLSDVRVVDRVPEDLAVLDGSPRAGVALDAGETRQVEYTVVARRGEYDFDPPRVRVRGASTGTIATAERPPSGDDRLACRLDADAPPLDDRGADRVGRRVSDDPGEGITFHSTREYRTDDPADRIDWRQYAKQGTLATVNYNEWVSTTVVLVLDARRPCHVAAGPGRPTAVELGAYAATRALTALLRSGHEVAVAVVGLDGDGPGGLAWLPAGTGYAQQTRAVELFREAVESGGGTRAKNQGQNGAENSDDVDADSTRQFRDVVESAGRRSQFVLVSPALDDGTVDALETWAAFDRPRILLSPDVVSANTVSGQYEAVERRTRLARCQATGARTIDWRRGTPLPVILDYAFAVDARRAAAGTGGGA